jgi:epoxyqueuosine reductase
MAAEEKEERKRKISRRQFLRGASGFVTGLAVTGRGDAYPPSPPQQGATWPCPCPCPCCGKSFDTLEALQEHIAAEHGRKLPEIRTVNKPTYNDFLVGRIERFDQKNTVFSRTVWDEEYKNLVRNAIPQKASYSESQALEGRALVAGAIYVDDAVGTLHPGYYGYSGHFMDLGGLYNWDDPVGSTQLVVSDPAHMSEQIKRVAKFYGADLVGICEVDQRWVYSHYFEGATGAYDKLDIPYKYAIVMAVEMDWEGINQSPGFEASAATALAYSQMAELSASLAKYIRALGYPAIPCGNDTAQSIPLAIDAGLGELGRNGLLVSPQFGPRQRICKVFTDLPLQPDQPIDFGLQRFCEICHICARRCPASAIKFGARTTEPTSISNRTGILRWPVDVAKCYLFWQENGADCSNCVAACPWNWPIRRWI